MKVFYHDPVRRADEKALNVTYLAFDDLLASADFILAMAPLSSENRGMFGAAQFAKMRPSTYFINSARGELVDTEALCDALRQGKIAYAALDVVDPEPLPSSHPLLSLPNVLLTPHIGTADRRNTRCHGLSGGRKPAGRSGPKSIADVRQPGSQLSLNPRTRTLAMPISTDLIHAPSRVY